MHDNFEKKVQKKMEGLNLSPSAPVWQNIEEELRPEKKRRRSFFWWLVPVVAAVGVWWYATGPAPEKEGNILMTGTPPGSKPPDTVSTFHHAAITAGGATPAAADATKPATAEDRKTPRIISIKKSTKTIFGASNNRKKPVPSFNGQQNRGEAVAKNGSTKTTGTTTPAIYPDKPEGSIEIVPAKGEQPLSKETVGTKKEFLPAVDSVKNKEIKIAPFLLPVQTDSAAAKIKVARQSSKWSRHVTIRVGWSNYGGSYGRVSAPLQYNSGGINSGTGFTPSRSSKITPGLFFSVGYGVRKGIGKRFQLGAGLQYSYYSASSPVGSLQTSGRTVFFNANALAISQYYTDSGQHTYHNQFGVLELPVHLQYQFLKKVPVVVSAGISYGWLITSNALTYDAVSGTYYVNKENNRRHYLNGFSAVQYQVKRRGKLKIEAGPVVQYNLLKVQTNAPSRSHLFSAGLKTDIFF